MPEADDTLRIYDEVVQAEADADTKFNDNNSEPLHVELPFIVPVEHGTDLEDIQEIVIPSVADQVQEIIDTLQPESAQEASVIFELITEKLQIIIENNQEISEISEKDIEELEQCTARLLTCLGIEPSSKNIKQFINILLAEQKQKSLELPEITDEGTHEKKSIMNQLFDDIGVLINPSLLALGKYAMVMTVSERQSESYIQE